MARETPYESLVRIRANVGAQIADKERDVITLNGELSALYSVRGQMDSAIRDADIAMGKVKA